MKKLQKGDLAAYDIDLGDPDSTNMFATSEIVSIIAFNPLQLEHYEVEEFTIAVLLMDKEHGDYFVLMKFCESESEIFTFDGLVDLGTWAKKEIEIHSSKSRLDR